MGEETPTPGYSLVCPLSEGGVGRVELALRSEGKFQRLYAVKRLHSHFARDAEFRAMFLDEANLAGLIRHPNVISVLDIGEDEQGPYLVMEYIEGLSLSELMKQKVAELPVQVALRIVAQCARGLHAAHELRDHDGNFLNLIHRDVSPQNVMLGFDAIARVTDFGVAKAAGRSSRTATGVLKGKFGYMSPEQLRFEKLDRRADVFSLGIVLFELLSGKRLYQSKKGEDANEGVQRLLHEDPPDIGLHRPDVPSSIVQLLFRMLAKTVDKRPEDCESVALVLEDAVRELEADEGPYDVRTYLKEEFAEMEEERRASVRAKVLGAQEKLRAAPPLGVPAPVPALSPPSGAAKSRWPYLIGVGVLGALAIGAGIGALGGDDAAIDEPVITTQPVPTTVPAAVTPIVDPAVADPATEDTPQMAEEPAAEPTRMRRRPRRESPPAMSAMSTMEATAMEEAPAMEAAPSMRGIPTLGWDDQ